MKPWPIDSKNWLRLDWGFLAVMGALFSYALGKWAGVIGGEPNYSHPLRFVFLTSALFLQSAGSLARRRSRPVFYALLVTSVVMLGLALVTPR